MFVNVIIVCQFSTFLHFSKTYTCEFVFFWHWKWSCGTRNCSSLFRHKMFLKNQFPTDNLLLKEVLGMKQISVMIGTRGSAKCSKAVRLSVITADLSAAFKRRQLLAGALIANSFMYTGRLLIANLSQLTTSTVHLYSPVALTGQRSVSTLAALMLEAASRSFF